MPLSSSSSPLPSSSWQSLPLTPGVYLFKDAAGSILYVGKAKNLRARVSSYFRPPNTLGIKTARLVEKIASLEHIDVDSEVEALLLEANLIKRLSPPYNIDAKDDKTPYYISISKEAYPKPILSHNPKKSLAGPFLDSQTPKRLLRLFRRIAPFCTSQRPVSKPCFYAHLGLCSPCPGAKSDFTKTKYLKNIARLRRLLAGNITFVRVQLEREMQSAAKIQNFESAAQARNHLLALDQLLRTPVSPAEYLANPNLIQDQRHQAIASIRDLLSSYFPKTGEIHRIEMYDIAHLSGTAATGSMTVAIEGEVISRHYRHFTVKGPKTTSDIDSMKEVLSRRLKRTDWPAPDLIVLDGGKPQLSIIAQLPTIDHQLPPIISLAKREETIIVPTSSGFKEINFPASHPGLRLLQHLRNEAHRFSRRLHHKHRQKLIIGS